MSAPAALAGFQAKLRRNETKEAFKAARRDCRLLEELCKRRLAEWLQVTNRELDQLASDLYLARWDCRPRAEGRAAQPLPPATLAVIFRSARVAHSQR